MSTDKFNANPSEDGAPFWGMRRFENPEWLILLLAFAMPISFSAWNSLVNNFAVEAADFTGREIGILQSIREIPGFMAFTVAYILLVIREQRFALISLIILGVGVAVTGFFPFSMGLYITTLVMSIGFHYFESIRLSLTLQWINKERTPLVMGRQLAMGSAGALAAFAFIFIGSDFFELKFSTLYVVAGIVTVFLALFASAMFPIFKAKVQQHKKPVLRKKYWLYYVLVFLSGARRQIFVVFAGFLMVEKFGYSVSAIAGLFIINHLINLVLAPLFGKFIAKYGERKALLLEYGGLAGVFFAYAFVESGELAAILYVVDHMFFALAIAANSYFQKIADPADIAGSAGVSFTINHIAAVFIPVSFGMLWLVSPSLVFLSGSAIAVASFFLALLVPRNPRRGQETALHSFQIGLPRRISS